MLRLDPHLAVFRIAPDRIAIGAQQPVAVLDADPPTLCALAALTRGVLRQELDQLIGAAAAAALLAALAPALVDEAPRVPLLVRGRVPLAARLHRAARETGHPASGEGVVVPVAPWRLPDAETARLLAAGVAHLPVVVGDAWLQIGPFVPRGSGCARCGPPPAPVLPAHLTPTPTPIAAAQAVAAVLSALERAGEGSLPEGWAVRVAQRDGAVSAVRRRRACAHPPTAPSGGREEARAPRGTARAA